MSTGHVYGSRSTGTFCDQLWIRSIVWDLPWHMSKVYNQHWTTDIFQDRHWTTVFWVWLSLSLRLTWSIVWDQHWMRCIVQAWFRGRCIAQEQHLGNCMVHGPPQGKNIAWDWHSDWCLRTSLEQEHCSILTLGQTCGMCLGWDQWFIPVEGWMSVTRVWSR